MKRCPKCGSGGELINGLEYYAAQAGGFAVGAGAAVVASLFVRNHAAHLGHTVHRNLTDGLKKEYKCTNPKCKHIWKES